MEELLVRSNFGYTFVDILAKAVASLSMANMWYLNQAATKLRSSVTV